MHPNRREWLNDFAAACLLAAPQKAGARPAQRWQAIAFDAFVIFDPRPLNTVAEELFPGRGADLMNLWRTRQFEYTWLRTMVGRYADFWRVTEDALVFAASGLKLDLANGKRDRLMAAYLDLRCWRDVPAALRSLKSAGIRLALLSNMTSKMLESGIRNSNLDGVFDRVLSTDRVRAFKPDARAYQMGVDELHLRRKEIAFAAFAGWDAAGAKTFGYPTLWVNRLGQPGEELGVVPDAVFTTLSDLIDHIVPSGAKSDF